MQRFVGEEFSYSFDADPITTVLSTLSEETSDFIEDIVNSLPSPSDSLDLLSRFKAESPNGFARVLAAPLALRYLLTVFSYSSFLSEAVIQNPEWVLELAESGEMHRTFTPEDFELQLAGLGSARELASFRRRQLLRVLLRDVLSFASLPDVTEELSNLADAMLNVAYRQVRRDLTRQHGVPFAGGAEALFSVISLGKLGGRELNYSSDIDLMFVYSGNGETTTGLSNKEFFKKLANQCTDLLSSYTVEGLCYRVDLRLRPDGRYGEVCLPLSAAKRYYTSRARDWELQMLIKARVSAGDTQPGGDLLDFVEPSIYSTTLDFKAVESVTGTRERVHEKLHEKGLRKPTGLDIKLARGGIRDIEFLVQCLQRLHGGREPWIRHGGTQQALFRLRDKELLSDGEYARLTSAYRFLRELEHRLQFQDDRQTHTLPLDLAQLDILARKMPNNRGAEANAGTLERELDSHFSVVQELYDRVIRSQRPLYDNAASPAEQAPSPAATAFAEGRQVYAPFPSANLGQFLSQVAPRFTRQLQETGILRGRDRLEHFLEKIVRQTDYRDALENNPELGACILDLFEHSHFLGDQMLRYPELVQEVQHACGERQGRVGFQPPRDAAALRQFFRRQMVRIQSDSVYHRVPIFKTLKRTSDLADSVIASAYEIAVSEAPAARLPRKSDYRPLNQMLVIALGRLGMREFDLASDADLVFVIPDTDAHETSFWTGVAERITNLISAYTGDGVLFTVDTRLRPNGREGALVQTEGAFRDYFSNHAEAWEGISYMKARGVAGDLERATAFLSGLQAVDWRRYGQSGRSREQLAGMRARLEREQGARSPLKAGFGGYYDIDFALMYYRLKGAGMFFKALNTPERIDVIEKMGHLEREDALFLRDAATFYRALDHGLRISTGHAEGRLPTSPAQLSVLGELVSRWDAGDRNQTIESRLLQIRKKTRVFFERVFSSNLG